jgi:hypothetical protein
MKRSEMIEKIKEKLEGTVPEINWAYQILRTVEELGMLPPFSHDAFIRNWHKSRNESDLNGNEWDPENE